MSACLVCSSAGFTPVFQGSDRLYDTTTRQFTVVPCGECGLLPLLLAHRLGLGEVA